MKTNNLLPVARVIFSAAVLLLAGCASTEPVANSTPSIMIAVRVAGGTKPTPQQIPQVYQLVSGDLVRDGWHFAKSRDEADYMRVASFTPNAINPNNGTMTLSRIRQTRDSINSGPDNRRSALSGAQDQLRQLDARAKSRESTT